MPQKKDISLPDLDKYLEGRKTFVNFAKAANATWALCKTAMVDLDKLDKYLDEYCVVESEREDKNMANGRKPIENLDEMVKTNRRNM